METSNYMEFRASMATEIFGSEKFQTTIKSSEDLIKTIHPSVKLYSQASNAPGEIDPVTYEVIRHSFWQITNEMGEVLKRTSGSVVVTEANDFNLAISNEIGDEVQIGLFNTELSASMDMAIKWTLEHRSKNPGIRSGDIFLCNDPWVGGGLHQNDVSFFAPFFYEEELFAWTSAVAHQIDLGGVSPGSWTPRSESVFWESLPTPPLKIVENNQIQSDVEDAYLRRSRVPSLVAIDIRAMVAANNKGQERLRHLISKYGANKVKLVMEKVMNLTETRVKQRLSELNDGEWRAIAYQDVAKLGDRGIYKILLKMSKRREHLTFDFTGTDKQIGMINCTYAGMRGGIMSAILPLLCWDMPWSPGGISRTFDVISEKGTLNNCTFPAGICKASVSSTWATKNVVVECLSGMLGMSSNTSSHKMAVSCGGWDLVMLSGQDQRKQPFVAMLMDPMAGGLGARVGADGVDTGGSLGIPQGQIPDVEINEFNYPILYLWRREEVDSGGPGKFRGGMSASTCFILHDTDRIHIVGSGSGKALAQAVGLDGGYPGSTQTDIILKDSNIYEILSTQRAFPINLESITGEKILEGPEYEIDIFANDVFFTQWQGGGGIGDPIQRKPESVKEDVIQNRVSIRAAEEIYGVSIDSEGRVDEEETSKLRRKIIEARRRRIKG